MFAYIYPLVIDKDICDCWNISVKLPCVYVCHSSGYLFIFSVRFASLFSYFCEDLVMNFDIPSENDLIRKYCEQSPQVSESVRNSWWWEERFLNLNEFRGIMVCVVTQFTTYRFSWAPLWYLSINWLNVQPTNDAIWVVTLLRSNRSDQESQCQIDLT